MYYFSTAVAVTSLTGPPVGAWILKNNIWLPFELSFVLYLICYPVLLFLPETLRPQNHAEHVTSEPSNENSPLLNSDAAPQNYAEHVTSEPSNENSPPLNSDNKPFFINILLCSSLIQHHCLSLHLLPPHVRRRCFSVPTPVHVETLLSTALYLRVGIATHIWGVHCC